MYYVNNIKESEYKVIAELLPEICPYVPPVILVNDDINLARLGFVDDPPCIIALNIDENTYNRMIKDLLELEIFADFDNERSESYRAYLKYNWMYDVFNDVTTEPVFTI